MFEYAEVLNKACDAEEAEKRISLIACFICSQFSYLDLAFNKPFNPLLGETFEIQTD